MSVIGRNNGCLLILLHVLWSSTLYCAHGFVFSSTRCSYLCSSGLNRRPLPPPFSARLKYISSSSSSSSSLLPLTIDDVYDGGWAEISSRIDAAGKTVQLKSVMKTLSSSRWYETFSREWFGVLSSAMSDLQLFYRQLPLWAEIGVVVVPITALLAIVLYRLSFPPDQYRSGMEPYVRGRYDPVQARLYYRSQKRLVFQRLLQMLRLSFRFLCSIALDQYVFQSEEKNRPQRANELLRLITDLGPTAIKVGQALSVRQDLIAAEYATALSTLQDQVPPFHSGQAREILRRELGDYKLSQLTGLSKEPVASASIGQVYKGVVHNNDPCVVAVKVQRPNALAEIALDLYIVREIIAPIYQKLTRTGTDLQGLANEWGRGFIAELDYRKEAASTTRFNEEMTKRNLNAVVCAPVVVHDYSTEQILVTEWVDGTRIDQCTSSSTRVDDNDIPRLCSVALNAYLVMLLELQSLHCDPHPGNLLRTQEGKLCILDFGMTLEIDPNLQYALLEYVAHLTSENYDRLPEDFVQLGFLKEERLEFVRRSGVLDPLKYLLRQLNQGGGADAIRNRIFSEYREKYKGLSDDELRMEMRSEMKAQMKEVVERESVATGITIEVEELQRQNRDSFRIPEWFLYTSRAFLTLEGVSLQADPSYSIIKSCFPYVAKRLVADDDPRARKALKELIYGATNRVDVQRLADLADGFTRYTTTTKTMNSKQQPQPQSSSSTALLSRTSAITRVNVNGAAAEDDPKMAKERERRKRFVEAEATITLAKDSADILFAPNGNLVQDLLIEESALAASAQVKDALRRVWVDGPRQFREALPLGIGAALPTLPFENELDAFVRKTPDEERAQALAGKLSHLAAPTLVNNNNNNNGNNIGNATQTTRPTAFGVNYLSDWDAEQSALVLKELRENLPKYSPRIQQLGGRFAKTLLTTASANIESTLYALERNQTDPVSGFVLKQTAKTLSEAAQRGAVAFAATTENATTTTTMTTATTATSSIVSSRR